MDESCADMGRIGCVVVVVVVVILFKTGRVLGRFTGNEVVGGGHGGAGQHWLW